MEVLIDRAWKKMVILLAVFTLMESCSDAILLKIQTEDCAKI